MLKRIASILLGIGLIGLGALFFLAPGRPHAMELLMGFWPVFLILAGLVRAAGYLIDRHPKSPVGGVITTAVGGIILAANLRGEQSFIQILGAYWFWLLLALIIGRILKQYTHRFEDGARPKAFSAGATLLMVLIFGAGVTANYYARHGELMSGLNFQIGPFSEKVFTVEDPEQSFALSPNMRLALENFPGDVAISTSPRTQAAARLIKRINADNQEVARSIAQNIRLQIATEKKVTRFSLADEAAADRKHSLTLVIDLPEKTPADIDATNVSGAIKLSGLIGSHNIRIGNYSLTHNQKSSILGYNVSDSAPVVTLRSNNGKVELHSSAAAPARSEIAEEAR